MMVTLGESEDEIKSLEDFAGSIADDLIGWNERKDGELIRHPGILDKYELSRVQADEMIMAARLAAGWVTEEDLVAPEVEEEVEEVIEAEPAKVINVIEDTTV